jgi:hypothetical protein
MHRTVLSHPEEITANGTVNVDEIFQIRICKILGSWESDGFWGTLPSRSIGIMQLAENLAVIYGAQALRGKILSRRDLGLIDQFLLTPLSLWL